MITSNEIETKINIYNNLRNICLNNIQKSNNKYEKSCYMDIVELIDEKMKCDNVEHYIYWVNL